MRSFFHLALILSNFGFVLHAQTRSPAVSDTTAAPETPDYFFSEVVVTAPRVERAQLTTPYAIDVLDRDATQRGEIGLSLEESLRQTPGVLIHNRHNLSQGDRIVVRGIGSRASFGVRGVKVVLDGIPLTLPDGQTQLNNLELGSVGKIELLRGPSSSLYGNASGGVLLVESDAAGPNKWLFQPRLTVGSYGQRKWQGRLSGTLGAHQYFLSASQLRSDGFREHAYARSTSINLISKHRISNKLTLGTVISYYDAPYLFNPSSLSKGDAQEMPRSARFFIRSQGASKQVRQGQGGLSFKLRPSPSEQWQTMLYGFSRKLLNPIPGRIVELDRVGGGVRSAYSRRFDSGRLKRISFGADFEIQADERAEFLNDGLPPDLIDTVNNEQVFAEVQYGAQLLSQTETVWGIGPFAELEIAVSATIDLTIGVRFDQYRFEVEDQFRPDGIDQSGTRDMNQLSPMVGLVYRSSENVSVYSNFSTAFQTPTTSELGNQAEREGGFNPALKPERIRSFEVGIKGFWYGSLQLQAALYRMTLLDQLIPFQIEDTSSEEIFFRNAGEARNNGFEMSLTLIPFANLRLSAAYTFADFKFQDYALQTQVDGQSRAVQLSGNDVPGVSPHHLFFGLVYEHTSGVYAEWNGQWFDSYFGNDFNGPAPGTGDSPRSAFVNGAYTTTDLRFGLARDFGPFALDFFIGLNNIFDARYNGSIVPNAVRDRFFEPAPGFNWFNGVSLTFQGG